MNVNYCQTLVYGAIWVAGAPEFVIERHGLFVFALVHKCYSKICIRMSKFGQPF